MVDKYITCTRPGCTGVMERYGGDSRNRLIKFVCNKCGFVQQFERKIFEAGINTFQLNDPNDPLRSGLK